MNELTNWAHRHQITHTALSELVNILHNPHVPDGGKDNHSEAWVASNMVLEAAYAGSRMWRNNVGAFKTEEGGFVRYGLCNETTEMNQKTKSSDYVGITPLIVTPEHVGRRLGIFTAAETKKQSWSYKATKEEMAQLNYLNLVNLMGGIAGFINNAGQFESMLKCQSL